MNGTIIKRGERPCFDGCDFVVQLPPERKGTKIRLLQLTDMQIIDSTQRRTPDRLRIDEINAWLPRNFDIQCGNHIRSLVTQIQPDLIFITGDLVYGSFDDQGSTFQWFCRLMDSFQIPWAPVFGNHDNESLMGVDWQCAQLEQCEYCLFQRGNVSGNGNYSVGIAVEDQLIRVIHMLDSNGCSGGIDSAIVKTKGMLPDQLALVKDNTARIRKAQGREVPGFMAFHIPVDCFVEAETEKGYRTEEKPLYILGVDVPARDGDFGFKLRNYAYAKTGEDFIGFLQEQNIQGVFVGHIHTVSTCITYREIRWVFGLKTGQYDYHVPGQVGGTMVCLEQDDFSVTYVPSGVPYAQLAGNCDTFAEVFAESKILLEG